MPEYSLPITTRKGKIDLQKIKPSDVYDWMRDLTRRPKEALDKKRSQDYKSKEIGYTKRE